jgi:hypothetical protein
MGKICWRRQRRRQQVVAIDTHIYHDGQCMEMDEVSGKENVNF